MLFRTIALFCFIAISVFSHAQVGHPAKGSWSGTLNSDAAEPSRIRLLIHAHNGSLSGVINPGRHSVDIKTIELDAAKWQMSIVADMPEGKLSMQGTLSNLGSWHNRKYQGTYTLGKTTGNFDITLN